MATIKRLSGNRICKWGWENVSTSKGWFLWIEEGYGRYIEIKNRLQNG